MSALKLLRPCIFLYIALALVACQPASDQNTEEVQTSEAPVYTGARLVQVDSIMIDLIGNFKVYDYQPETDLFLGGDIGGFMIIMGSAPPSNELGHVIFNRHGEILHQFNHADNGPEGHSAGAYDHAFLGTDDIGVMSKKALYRYGIDGSYVGKYTDLNTFDLVGFSGQRMIFSHDGAHIALGLPKGMEEAKSAWDSIFQIVRPLWFYDLGLPNNADEKRLSVKLVKATGYPDHPIYAPDNEIGKNPFPPLMSVNHLTEELFVVYPLIPQAWVYDMKRGGLKTKIDLAPANFEVETPIGNVSGGVAGYGGLLWSNKGGRMANARYQELTQLGDYTLLRYSLALPSSVVNELVSAPVLFHKNENWPRIRKKHYRYQYQLFKNGEKVLPDFELPLLEPKKGQLEMANNRITRGKIIGGNGLDEVFVFVPNDGDEERDYELIRVYKLELNTQ